VVLDNNYWSYARNISEKHGKCQPKIGIINNNVQTQ
jgi:hypothetical protein